MTADTKPPSNFRNAYLLTGGIIGCCCGVILLLYGVLRSDDFSALIGIPAMAAGGAMLGGLVGFVIGLIADIHSERG
jgi:hypothetical protein